MVGDTMQYILGLLTPVVFFVVFYMGMKYGKKQGKPVEIDEEQARKAQRIKEDFQKLMNYDVSTALQRKKVK